MASSSPYHAQLTILQSYLPLPWVRMFGALDEDPVAKQIMSTGGVLRRASWTIVVSFTRPCRGPVLVLQQQLKES